MNLIKLFRNLDFEVHNAHLRENGGSDMMTPETCTIIDFEKISTSDYLIAFPGNPASPGTHIEPGWASALKKRC